LDCIFPEDFAILGFLRGIKGFFGSDFIFWAGACGIGGFYNHLELTYGAKF